MSSTRLSPLQAAIVKHCEEHKELEKRKHDFKPYVSFAGYFIRYGNRGCVYPQYKTQQYISGLAGGDASSPHIPKVYDHFTSKHTDYLVMECIEAGLTPARDAPEKVAKALQWLRDLPAPPGVTIGPVGGGHAHSKLFKDFTAPLPFSSKEALERYMNTVCLRLSHFPKKLPPV